MQALKVICAAFLLMAVTAHPSNDIGKFDEPEPKHELEWWEGGLFYQIYPRSFKDSDDDGIGDIRGIIESLDYLVDLGVDGAWLSPIFKSPMVDFGYDISDFYDVDPIFGTMADLEELFQKAKEKNIKIILDFVPNHTSDQNEWFKKSVKREEGYEDFYIWADAKGYVTRKPPNNWVSVFYGSAWTYNNERKQYYYHGFAEQQPDLNYRNPAVVKEMLNVLNFWLEKGVAGFRIDAVNHLFEYSDFRDEPLSGNTKDPKSYDYLSHDYTKDLPEMYQMVYKFRETTDEFQKKNGGEKKILMTEAYANDTEYPKYFKSEDGKKHGSQMPFNFKLITDLSKTSTAADLKKIIDSKIASVPKGTRLNWVTGNHDKPRVASRFGDRRIDGLLALVMTLPGIAVTYMGEEIGMEDNRDGISFEETQDPQACNVGRNGNWKEISRDPQRTPFQWDGSKFAGFMPENSTNKPWLPVHPNHRDLNVALQNKVSQHSTLKFYKALSQLRKEHSFLDGSFDSIVMNENVFGYVRTLNGKNAYLVLINFGAREAHIDLNSLPKEIIDGDLPEKMHVILPGTDSYYRQGEMADTADVVLREYDVVILNNPHDPQPGGGHGGGKTPGSGSIPSSIASIAIIAGLLCISMNVRFIF